MVWFFTGSAQRSGAGMFGLPMSTTLIMGGVMLFWIVYTIVFYVSTRNWVVEDADYDTPAGEADPVIADGGDRA
jgi:hypothetical protein